MDSFILKIFEIVLINFNMKNKLEKTWFFQKTFLLIDFIIEMILKILFFIFNNANI